MFIGHPNYVKIDDWDFISIGKAYKFFHFNINKFNGNIIDISYVKCFSNSLNKHNNVLNMALRFSIMDQIGDFRKSLFYKGNC